MSAIREIRMRRVYDSRGRETVEATIETEGAGIGIVGAPSGASTGTHEVRSFPDGGVAEALRRFASHLAPALRGLDASDQAGFDAKLHAIDGTPDFGRIGGNVATALSVAVAQARARETHRPLWRVLARPGVDGRHFPAIVGNSLNGGRHAIGGPDMQEFIAFAPAKDPADSVRAALEVHRRIGEALHKRLPTHALGRGDEGGWVAPIGNRDALEVLSESCASVRDDLKLPVHPGLDLAASEFYRDGKYRYADQALDPEGQFDRLTEWTERFDLRYIEDPFFEEDFDSFARLTAAVGHRALVVGDDLYTTAVDRVRVGAERKSSNAVLVKVNQVGTLTDTFATIDFARAHGMRTVTSHRSGDLPEGWLAHLAVASDAAGLKCGLLGGERVAKLNELLSVGAAQGA